MTMEIHHGRHHKAYVDNLNKALEGQAALASKPIDQLLREIKPVPDNIRQAVINNGGGHANHSMFWEIMASGAGGKPSGPLADDITKTFGDFAAFQGPDQASRRLAASAAAGPGWSCADGKLQIISTANQDSPLHERPDPDPRRRCLGTRLLPEVPEQAARLPRRLVERRQLERQSPSATPMPRRENSVVNRES